MKLAALLSGSLPLALWLLVALGAAWAQEAVPEFVELKHPASGKTMALVNPAALRNHGQPLAGFETAERMPGAVLHSNPAPAAPDATVREAARRLGIAEPESGLFFKRSETDGLLMVHEEWGQQVNSVPVFGAGVIVHRNARGEVTSIGGRILPIVVPGFSPSDATSAAAARELDGTVRRAEARDYTTPRLSAQAAREIALRLADGGPRHAGLSISSASRPKLYLYNAGFLNGGGETDTHLVWQVAVSDQCGGSNEATYYIDARDGNLVHYDDGEAHLNRRIYDCTLIFPESPGCRIDLRLFLSVGWFYLGRSEGQPARGPMPSDPGPPYAGSLDVDNAYDFFVPRIHQYVADRLGRNGANDRGGTGNGSNVPFDETRFFANGNGSPIGLQACNPGFAWATATGVGFCIGSLTTDSYDVLGHEYGHLISRYRTFNLDGTLNSLSLVGLAGTLNENVSDVYGEAFEHYMTGTNDWQLFIGSIMGRFRSLSDPASSTLDPAINLPQPDRYHSPNFYCGAYDSGGIHHNATVPGKAAYLTAAGGSFNGCSVTGIGTQKVEQIWYRASVNYYAASETFNGAYNGLIQACHDLYPVADCAELTKALQAVEMDQPGKCSGLPARPATCRPEPLLRSEMTPVGPRYFWGADCAGWTLQMSFDLVAWTDVQTITAPGEYVPQVSAARMYCRLRY